MTKLKIKSVPGTYAIARLPPDAPIPDWIPRTGFLSLTRASDELTITCAQQDIPDTVETDRDWSCLRTIGPFTFDAAGIVAALINPLSEAGIGVFVCCTFDGEHLLVKTKDMQMARELLETAGHHLIG